jgi:pilus assembly protein Flp/PilA
MVEAVALPLDAYGGRAPSGIFRATRHVIKIVQGRFIYPYTIARISTVANGFTQSMEAGLRRSFLKFLSDQSGATAIEYGLIAAGISLAIIAVVNGLGSNLNTKFDSINTSLK